MLKIEFIAGTMTLNFLYTVIVGQNANEALILWKLSPQFVYTSLILGLSGLFVAISIYMIRNSHNKKNDMNTDMQAILDTMPISVAIADIERMEIVYGNNGCKAMLESASNQDIIGKGLAEIFYYEKKGDLNRREITDYLAKLSETVVKEVKVNTIKGKVRDMRMWATPINYMGKQAIIGIFTDLSAENEYRKTQGTLQMVLDTMPVPVRIVDIGSGKIIYMNKSCMEMFEADRPEEAFGSKLSDVLPEYQSDGTPSSEKIRVSREKKEPITQEVEYLTFKGRIIDTQLSSCHISYNGRPASIGIIRDFADVKELAKTRHSLQTILDILPVAIRIIDIESDSVVYVNKATFNLLGTESRDFVYGRRSAMIMPETQPDGRNSIEKLRSLDHPEPTTGEFVCYRFNGERIDTSVTSCIIDYKGRKASLAIITDLTAEKEYKRMLMNTAEKEKEANQLKSRFLVNMSHEIRTPMNAIIGLTEIELRREAEPNKLLTYKKVNDSAKNLLSIINDILDLSKIEADKIELYDEEIKLEEVIGSAILVSMPRLDGKEVEFILNTSLDLPQFIRGDRTRLWQILKNFLDNSGKYTDKGRIILTVFEDKDKSDNKNIYLSFTIEDTGIGVSEDQLQKLFTPYIQVYNDAQKRYAGTGLGMAISKQLCELMGGNMHVESVHGKGTKVFLNIPFKRSEAKGRLLCFDNYSNLSGTKVLVADIDKLSRSVISKLITATGAACKHVINGREALDALLENRNTGEEFDLILLNDRLDDMSGLEVGKQLKAGIVKTPVLFMVTAYQQMLLTKEIEDAGIADIIEKPIIPSQFIKKILSALGRDEAGTEAVNDKFIMFKDVSVLICEDYSLNYEVASGMFEEFGVKTTLALNGKEGIDKLYTANKFDMIFMDLQMPVMDGYEATRIIRSDKQFDNIPIISLTADAMKEIVNKCHEVGMDDHIAKPMVFEDIQRIFLKWLPESKRVNMVSKPNDQELAKASAKSVSVNSGINEELLEAACKHFVEDLPDEWPEFETAINDMERTRAFVHKIKGASGNLSEKDIYESSIIFEDSLRSNKPDKEAYDNLIKACTGFKAKISVDSGFTTAKQLGSGEEFNKLLDELDKNLRDYDMQGSLAAVKALEEKTWPGADISKLYQLSRLVRNFEYEDALDILSELIADTHK